MPSVTDQYTHSLVRMPVVQSLTVDSPQCGRIQVFVQGNLPDKQGKTVFLTVHDMGTNHKSWVNFVNEASMSEVKPKSVFLHVCVPGQDDNSADLKSFPTLKQLGEDLVSVLDAVDMKTCIAIGEGAGANVVCRFAMTHPNRLMGVGLVHCTSTTAGVLETIKDKVINWQMSGGNLSQAAWEYLVFHKFGQGASEKQDHVKQFIEDLQQRLNTNNLSKFIEAFQKRTDLSAEIAASGLKMDTLLCVGGKASHLHTVYTMHKAMAKDKVTLLVVDGVGDVLTEAADRFSRALILFCKGCGVLSGVSIPGMERQRTLSSSMEEADRPRKSSITAATADIKAVPS